MESVRIERDRLLESVRANYEAHLVEYDHAVALYRSARRLELQRWGAMLDGDQHPPRVSQLVEPESHAADYERAIRMLEMSVDTEVKVSDDEFRQLVLNEWHWRPMFAQTLHTSQRYLGHFDAE